MSATFVFKAIDLVGAQSKGEIEADSKQAVNDQLKQRGLIVLDIAEKRGSKEIKLPWGNRVKAGDLTIMTRQLSTMVSSGMTILRALYVLEAQTESDALKEVLVAVRKDVEAGLPLSDSLERHPKVFDPLFVAMVRAGETGGVLDSALLRVADQLEKAEALRRQVKSAMTYPTVIITFALVVVLALVTFLVPVFAGVFKEFGGQLPLITRVTVAASDFVKGYWYVLIVCTGAAMFGFGKFKKTPRGREILQRAWLKAPMKIGDIVQKVALARWSRTFSALITAGVPLLSALDIVGKTAGNVVIEQAMAKVTESVKSGGTIAGPLKESPVFPSMVGHMVGVGEETGAMDAMLSKIADFYEDQVAAAVKSLTAIIEPIMIIVVGAIVGFIVIAMYMPMFSLYDQIK
jgi:type IV pilus assembly protein PilC